MTSLARCKDTRRVKILRAAALVFGYSADLEAMVARFKQIFRTLRIQRAAAQTEVDKLERAIEALSELGGKLPGRDGESGLLDELNRPSTDSNPGPPASPLRSWPSQ